MANEAPSRPPVDDAAIVAAVLAVRPDARAVYRFGSTVTGYARPDSDVDVAVLVERPITGRERMALMADVGAAAHRDGDIMDLARASPIAQFEVMRDGLVLLGSDRADVAEFEIRAIRDYHDLARLRRPIVADLRDRMVAAHG